MDIKHDKSYFERRYELSKKHDSMHKNSPTNMAQIRNYSRYDVKKYLGFLEDKIVGDGNRYHGLVSGHDKEKIEEAIDNLRKMIFNKVDSEWIKYRSKLDDIDHDE